MLNRPTFGGHIKILSHFYSLLSDKNFQYINNLLIYTKLSNNFDKEACL